MIVGGTSDWHYSWENMPVTKAEAKAKADANAAVTKIISKAKIKAKA